MEGLQPPTQMTPSAENRLVAQPDCTDVTDRPKRKRRRRALEVDLAVLEASAAADNVADTECESGALDMTDRTVSVEPAVSEPIDKSASAESEVSFSADANDHGADIDDHESAIEESAVDELADPIDSDSTDPFAPMRLVEAVLFSSETPLTAARIASLVEELTPARVKRCIEALNEEYARTGRTFRIEHIARGYQMLSLSEYQPWLARAAQQRGETRLTSAAMETLAVIAYRQPAMRAAVEAVRGVACGDQINRLRELGLVKIVGRAEVVGRPMLYGTTKKFLDVFGLGDLRDLPPMEEFGLSAPRQTESALLAESGPMQQAENAHVDECDDTQIEPHMPQPVAPVGCVVSKSREEVEPVAPPRDESQPADFAA